MREITVDDLAASYQKSGRWPHRSWALLDIREPGEAERGHIPDATFLPRRQIEFRIADLVSAKATPLVVYGGADERARLAADTLSGFGYTDVQVLSGGFPAWQQAGNEVATGSNVPSKQFGERVLIEQEIPYITADELKRRMENPAAPVVVCDSRTPVEFERGCIPGAFSAPSFDLTLQLSRLARQYDTVVVNCAGRTRSIIGTATLQVLGVDRVVALENGTMGWVLAGLKLERGATRALPDPDTVSSTAGEEAAARLAERHAIARSGAGDVDTWMASRDRRNVYVFDVRPLVEYVKGHVPGSQCLPGGQACQRTDDFVAVHDARIVFVDNNEARSLVTAYWFRRMGFRNVSVLRGGIAQWKAEGRLLETGRGHGKPLELDAARAAVVALDVDALATWLDARPEAIVVDVGTSRQFKAAHLLHAHWIPRGWLEQRIGEIALPDAPVAVTASDPLQACYAAATLVRMGYRNSVMLDAGTAKWQREGRPVAVGFEGYAGRDDDVIDPPYEKGRQEMLRYIDWETKLGHEQHDETHTKGVRPA